MATTTVPTSSECALMVDLEASNPSLEIVNSYQDWREQVDSFDESNAPSEMMDTSLSSAGSDQETIARRRAVNTETSILNITEEEEDDDEGEDEFVVKDGESTTVFLSCDLMTDGTNEFARIPASANLCEKSKDTSLIDKVMDNFMDTVCFARDSNCGNNSADTVETNLIRMLGCIRPPDNNEEEVMQNTQTLLARLFCTKENKPKAFERPHRLSQRNRRDRVRKLLEERGFEEPSVFRSVNSLRSTKLGRGSLGIDDGYDSDPESVLRTAKQRTPSPRSVVIEDIQLDDDIHPIVQSSLNRSWRLTWHDGDTPRNALVWMERGTLVHNSMIEPRLMWRCRPWEPPQSIPLLHISRVRPCTINDVSGFVQLSTSIIIKAGGNTYVFQAPTGEVRDAVVLQWRLTVARFATLAVLEDANALLREFFSTTQTTPYKLAL